MIARSCGGAETCCAKSEEKGRTTEEKSGGTEGERGGKTGDARRQLKEAGGESLGQPSQLAGRVDTDRESRGGVGGRKRARRGQGGGGRRETGVERG